jgi:hypothetical protein
MSQTHINRLAADFEALQASKSWQITAPLRALGRLMRRIRGKPPGRELGEGLIRSKP